ncbi:MAG TPA: hypothetical protein VGP06_08385 [Janthinobacterium sp.]|nr:hypothetical protein [Janthinobacterium sp.]
MKNVPPEYVGVWCRSGIWRSNGSSDLSTKVWWFQSSRYHIDLRIPADRPSVASAAALAQLAPEQLARFAAQTGFAGVTVVEGERCEWRPAIAFPATSADLDAGWMRFDDADHIHETGLDKSYEEDWYREPAGPMHGVRLEEVNGNAIAYLLISEHWMAWACGRPGDAFLAAAPSQLACSEFTVYRRDGQWTAIASNFGWREGQSLALSLEQALQWQPGEVIELPMVHSVPWRVAV